MSFELLSFEPKTKAASGWCRLQLWEVLCLTLLLNSSEADPNYRTAFGHFFFFLE
jgi:hypothetical protein